STSQNAASPIMESGVRAINVPLALAGIALRLDSRAQRVGDLPVGITRGVLVDQRGPVAVVP
ncbi:hypothetical protein, partial [Microbispora siamensis]|uniref:hypothetical protein n=1 Tax=Microbispora siamensis TaxID=564413 RepID=UPI00194EB086